MNEKTIELRKSHWTDAANGGGVIGLIIVAVMFLDHLLNMGLSIVVLLVLIIGIFNYGRKRAAKYGDLGFTYGQSVGYIFTLMFFTGFVVGLGAILFFKFAVSHEQLGLMIDQWMEASKTPPQFEGIDMKELMAKVMQNPAIVFLTMVMGLLFYGGLAGLFLSPLIKTQSR